MAPPVSFSRTAALVFATSTLAACGADRPPSTSVAAETTAFSMASAAPSSVVTTTTATATPTATATAAPTTTPTTTATATSSPLASPTASAQAEPAAPIVFDFGMQPRSLTEKERAGVVDVAMKRISAKKVTLLVASPGEANAKAWGKLLRDYLVSGGIQEEALVVTPCVSPTAKVRSYLVDGEAGCDAIPK